MNRVELKVDAKEKLKGKYKDTTTLLLLMYGINFVVSIVLGFISGIFNLNPNTIDLLSQIASIVISGLLTFGYTSYFLKISRNEEVSYKELFSKTKMIIPYIVISWLTGIFIMLWSLLFIIPGIIASISYSLILLIKLDNPDLGVLEVIKKSKEMMNGHKMEFFVLELSFLGWTILGIFTFGILYFWLIPYIEVTTCNFYNKLKEQN